MVIEIGNITVLLQYRAHTGEVIRGGGKLTHQLPKFLMEVSQFSARGGSRLRCDVTMSYRVHSIRSNVDGSARQSIV